MTENPWLTKPDTEWRERLTQLEYHVLREGGTEAPFVGEYTDTVDEGTYACRGCGAELFDAEEKYDSGSGWPSFTAPVDIDAVEEVRDASHGMIRTEVRCAKCEGHLGHVFPDGPPPTRTRFCINSVSLSFVADEGSLPDPLHRGDEQARRAHD